MEATQHLGKFTLVRHIATGGMAEIWLAEQVGPGGFAKELVIKRILPHLARDQQFTTMFLDEARLVAQLAHPKIAQIYELGEIDGHYFIAMEYVSGFDVASLIELSRTTNKPIPIGIAVKLMVDTLEALDYAHDFTSRDGQPYHLVHRDVTPHNVLVSHDGIVKLVDFGVARAKQNQSKTQTGAVKGKFAYMAPEQIQNRELDRRVDIFATGVMLFEMLTLQKPFGEDLVAVSNILSTNPPPIRTLRPDVPPAVEAVILKALAKNPDERYADAHLMMIDLQNYLRSSGEFVGDREVASFLRELRGLPTVRHAANVASSQARVTPTELPVAVQPAPTPIPAAQPVSFAPSTAEVGVVSPPATETMATQVPAKSNTGLIAAFVVMLLLLAVAGVVVFMIAVKEDQPAVVTQPTTVVQPTTPVKAAKQVVPAVFNHPGGRIVYLKSQPSGATVEFNGTVVGTTPLDTNLKPGDYTVLLKHGARQVSKTFKVEDKLANSIELKF